MLQPWPSQCSASVVCCVKLLSAATPTAVQSDGDTQDTALMPIPDAPAGSGSGGCTLQLVPFHFSSSTAGVRSVLSFWSPTAKHSDGPPQETLFRKVFSVPLGLPMACIDQAVPFHFSMSRRWSAKLKLPTLPTAKHSTGAAHAMLLRSLG